MLSEHHVADDLRRIINVAGRRNDWRNTFIGADHKPAPVGICTLALLIDTITKKLKRKFQLLIASFKC
jgi:hypothetical protein